LACKSEVQFEGMKCVTMIMGMEFEGYSMLAVRGVVWGDWVCSDDCAKSGLFTVYVTWWMDEFGLEIGSEEVDFYGDRLGGSNRWGGHEVTYTTRES